MSNTVLNVQGMHCGSCEKLVTLNLGKIPGVKVNRVDHKKGEVDVTLSDASLLEKVKKTIESLNFKVA